MNTKPATTPPQPIQGQSPDSQPADHLGDTSPVADWVHSEWFRQWEALAYGSASFNNKNVGTAKPVAVSGITVTGTAAGSP